MKRQRYVLFCDNSDSISRADLTYLSYQLIILAQRKNRLIVEATPEHIAHLLRTLPNWHSQPYRTNQQQKNPGLVQVLKNHHRLILALILGGLFIAWPLL